MLNLISLLPQEIKEIIYNFIPMEQKCYLTKNLFVDYYKKKIKNIPLYQSYIRYIIRNNHVFIFNLNLHNNYKHWFNLKNWNYNNRNYKNYILYIKDYTNKQNKQFMYQSIKNIETKTKLEHAKIY